jgi:hypothetical protein
MIAPAVAVGLWTATAAAQDAGDPPVLFLDVAMGLQYEDERDTDGELEATTRLGVGYFTSTHNQRLGFESGITLRALEDRHDIIDPFVSISYARFSRNTEISADLTYRQAEVENGELDVDFDASDLARQAGTRESIDYGLRLVTGRASPFGTDTQLRYTERNFTDGATDDDSVILSVSTTFRFTIDPRIELRFTGFVQEEDTDDAVDTVETITRFTAVAALAIDRVWSASVGLGFAEVETETTGGVVSVDGLEGSFILTRDLSNGVLSLSSDHVVTADGWRNTVRLRRQIDLANGDVFNASIGQIFFEEGESGHLASLAYARTVRSGSFNAAFDFTSGLDDSDLLVQRTRFSASLRQDLTDNSGWSVDGSLARVDYDNPATLDALRANIGLAYLHALSNDWTLAARARHQVLYEDGGFSERTNVLSLNLERRFSVRP